MTIYTPSGEILYEAPITEKAKIARQLGGDHYIELSFDVGDVLPIDKGCYVKYEGCRYEVMTNIFPESVKGKDAYKYTVKFFAPQHKLQSRCVFWIQGTAKEATFNLTTTIGQYAQLIADNMNMSLGVSRWRVGSIPDDLTERTEFYKFDGVSCWDGLFDIAKLFNVECWIESNADEDVINFGKLNHGTYIDFKEGDIVTSIPASKGDDSDYGTRFYIFGGTSNLPSDYYEATTGGVTNHVSEKRLHLPNGKEYIDAWAGLADADIVERVVILDEIFPKNTETVTSVEVVDREIIDGETNKAYVMVCADTPFLPSMIVEGATLGATFTSGSLEGRSFELSVKKSAFDKRFEIIAQTEDAGGDTPLIIPNEYLHPETGDTFILTGIELPAERVSVAENELLIKGESIAAERSSKREVFKCPTNPVFCELNDINLSLGQRVTLVGPQFGKKGRPSRVQGFEKLLYNPYSATYEIGDNQSYSKWTAKWKTTSQKLTIAKEEAKTAIKNNGSKLNRLDHSTAYLQNEREVYKQEHTFVESEHEIIDDEYSKLAAEYQILRDSLGREMRDKNGYIMCVRKASSVYDTYKQSYKAYISAIDKVISSKGIANITPEYKTAENDYYIARAELSKAIAIGTKKKIADLDYLKDAFGADKVLDSDGVVLSQLVSVKDKDGNVVAGIYGGANDTLNGNGFESTAHGTLMQFAGASSAQDVANSKYRVYEDGTLIAEAGVFGGFVRKAKTVIASTNIDDFTDDYLYFEKGSLVAKIGKALNLDKAGAFIEFGDNVSWGDYFNKFIFPYFEVNGALLDTYPLDYMLSILGTTIVVSFKGGDFSTVDCIDIKTPTSEGLFGNCLLPTANDILVATCVAEMNTTNNTVVIGWDWKFVQTI